MPNNLKPFSIVPLCGYAHFLFLPLIAQLAIRLKPSISSNTSELRFRSVLPWPKHSHWGFNWLKINANVIFDLLIVF